MQWRTGASLGVAKASTKGVVLSLACGVAVGLFYPFVAKALTGPNHLGPYTVYFVFALGAAISNFPMNYGLMRRPVNGEPLRVKDYFKGHASLHAWGILGGAIWGIGTIANFVASYVPMIGPATSFSLGEGNTMISAIWGIFCVEGISRRGKPGQGSPRDYVSVLCIGVELYSARTGDPLGKRTLAELEHRRQDDEVRQ